MTEDKQGAAGAAAATDLREIPLRQLGKCDLDRVPHFQYELCEDWRPIIPDAPQAPLSTADSEAR